MADVSDLLLRIDATTEGLRRELRRAERSIDDNSKQINKYTSNVDKRFSTMSKNSVAAFGRMRGAIAAVGAALAVREVSRYADAWQSMTNQLKTVQRETESLADTQMSLLRLANETRSSVDATATLYTRLTRSTESLGLSQEEVIDLTRTINQAFAVSGATAQEASNAIIQLSQGLQAGALRGEEFNSVNEQGPIIMDALAKSLNVTRGELRELAFDGKLTTETVVNGLKNGAAEIDGSFNRMTATLGQGFTVATNSLKSLVGTLGEVTGISGAVANAFVGIGNATQGLSDRILEAKERQEQWDRVVGEFVNTMEGDYSTAVASASQYVDRLLNQQLDLTDATIRHNRAITQDAEVIAKLDELYGETARARARYNQVADPVLQEMLNKNLRDTAGITEEVTEETEQATEATEEQTVAIGSQISAYERLYIAQRRVGNLVETDTHNVEALAAGWLETRDSILHIPSSLSELEERMGTATFRMMGVNDKLTQTHKKRAAERAEADEEALERARDSWERTHDAISDVIYDAFDNGGNFFEQLGDAGVNAAKRIAAEWLALQGMNLFGFSMPGGGGSGVAGSGGSSLVGTVGQSVVGKWLGGTAIGSAAGQFVGGLTGTAVGTAGSAMVGPPTAAAAAGSNVAGFLTNPWTIGAGALLYAASQDFWKDPDSYKRSYAGLVTAPTPGAAGLTFDIPAFASGFAPQGVAHRASQQEAIQQIQMFRDIDARITQLTRDLGGNIDLSQATLSGVGAEGQFGTQGTFLGMGGMTTAEDLAQMANMFAGELVDHISGLDDELMQAVEAANSADEAIRLMTEALQEQEEALSPMEKAQKQAADSIVQAYESGLNELDSIRLAYDKFQQFAERGLTAAQIANFTGLMESEINSVLSRGAAMASSTGAIAGLSGQQGPTGFFDLDTFKKISQQSLGIDGSHADGLKRVPFDGYRAELHKNERVLTATETDSLDKMQSGMDMWSAKAERIMAMTSIYIKRIEEVIDDWNQRGLPDTRPA